MLLLRALFARKGEGTYYRNQNKHFQHIGLILQNVTANPKFLTSPKGVVRRVEIDTSGTIFNKSVQQIAYAEYMIRKGCRDQSE